MELSSILKLVSEGVFVKSSAGQRLATAEVVEET